MNQVATWYRERSRPRRHYGRWGPSSPSSEMGTAPLLFCLCLLWPNGWMEQDAAGTEVGLDQATLCYMRTQLPRGKGHSSPHFSAHAYCGQMAGWIRIPLGTEVGLGPCLLWPNGWMDQDTTWYGSRPRPRRHCVRCGPSSPPRIGAQQPPVFDPCLLWPNGWMNQDTTWYRSRPRFRRHCVRLC